MIYLQRIKCRDLATALKYSGSLATQQGGKVMWVFDGEKWIDEGAGSAQSELQQKTQDLRNWERDGFYPELQVIEITRIERREEIRGPILIP